MNIWSPVVLFVFLTRPAPAHATDVWERMAQSLWDQTLAGGPQRLCHPPTPPVPPLYLDGGDGQADEEADTGHAQAAAVQHRGAGQPRLPRGARRRSGRRLIRAKGHPCTLVWHASPTRRQVRCHPPP